MDFAVRAPLYLLQEVLPSMKTKKKGSIINIGSEVAQFGKHYYSSYVTAKAALIGMTRF